MSARKKLRELFARQRLLIAPGAFDGLSARLVEQAGFEAVYLSGGAVARSAGFPDLGLMSMSIADADTGYGNALSVVRTVREFERAGVAAIHIEDQVTPKRCGHLEGKEVIPLEEMEDKIRAALDARSDPDFIIIARTDAGAVHGLDDAIARARAFVKLGADAAFVEAAESEAELERIARELKDLSLVVNMTRGGKAPLLPAKRLDAMGYRVAIYPSDTQRAAMHAMQETLAALKRDGSTDAMDKKMVSFKERDRIAGLEEWEKVESRFLKRDKD
jgi:2-methylisocitrate lyase-like PEP mutase family enzyme